jgi:hypothetical protein
MFMKKNKDVLKIILVALIAVFVMVGIAAALLVGYRKSEEKEKAKQQAIDVLESIPRLTPTVVATATPTPIPTATPTPTVVPTIKPAFNPDVYWDSWYSTDGAASVNIYNISFQSVSFLFAQSNADGTVVCEADVTAEVAGNAAQFSFTDSQGNAASGNFTFDNGKLYVRIVTTAQANVSVAPNVDCIMVRERPGRPAAPTATPAPTSVPSAPTQPGDYYFPDSNSRYLTDEELQNYSSSELELAKNEIYARHGRQFVTQRIADYFNSKSWYQGTIDPETFDAQQSEIFNEYETANISKIVEWENKKRSEGQ